MVGLSGKIPSIDDYMDVKWGIPIYFQRAGWIHMDFCHQYWFPSRRRMVILAPGSVTRFPSFADARCVQQFAVNLTAGLSWFVGFKLIVKTLTKHVK